jgi:RNA polymerase sigma-B factor
VSTELIDAELVEGLLEEFERASDQATRDRLMEAVVARTMPVADRLAHHYAGRGVDVEDLEQVARAALVAAINRYDHAAGPGFLAFAVPTITGEIKRHFRDHGWVVRPPRHLQDLRSEVVAAEDALCQRLRRTVRVDELAGWLSTTADDVRRARACATGFRPLSLDAPSPLGGTVGERVSSSADAYSAADVHSVLVGLVSGLGDRDRTIVRMRYVEERTQSEIGEAIGVSQVQVSRLLSHILGTLRAGLEAS